jgi:hypothetical protein
MAEQQWQRLVDSVEGAFSLEVPAGWQGDVRTLRVGQLTRRAVRAVSPDGSVRLSLHDPDLPAFYEPSSGMFVTPGVHQLMPFVPAETFLPQYLQQRFGAAPGFTIGAVVDEPDLVRDTVQRAAAHGYQVRPTASSAEFSFTDQGNQVAALMMCSTTSFGPTWAADVFAVFAVGGGRPDRALLLHALRSERTNDQWQAGENQLFANQQMINAQQSQQWMNVMTQGHNQRMGDIAAAGMANTAMHNDRMAMGKASTDAYLDRLNQPVAGVDAGAAPGLDQQHAIINGIREEETVHTASGDDVQVDAGVDRYFVDERNRTWVGAQGNVQANDFTAAGLNPDDYQEGQIRR